MMERASPEISILAVGQSFRGDDGAGPEAVRRWQIKYPQTAKLVDVLVHDAPGPNLLESIKGHNATLIVDALRSSASPGTVLRLTPNDLAVFTAGSVSAHGWGVAETLSLGFSLYPELANSYIVILGIVGNNFSPGVELSPDLQASLDEIADQIETEARQLLHR
jgi:hydrogenase maturation protease